MFTVGSKTTHCARAENASVRAIAVIMSIFFMFIFLSVVRGLMGRFLFLFLDTEVLGGGFENHAVNDLFGQMHLVKPDAAFITGLGLLHGDKEPVLLFDGIAAAFVVAGLVGLVVLFAVGVVKPLAKDDSARRAARDGGGIAFGKHTAEGRAARAQAHISSRSGDSGAAREQAHDTNKWDELNERIFHKCFGFELIG
jgi:hypothetical protein